MSIVLDRLNKYYGPQTVVDDVSLHVRDGELFVLLGASGSGKSTILRLIAGLANPDSGRVQLHGKDVTDLPPQNRGTGFVFQNYSLFRHMTIAENIEFGLRVRRKTRAERIRRRDEMLELVGLAGYGARYAHQLSGGQQQRVALARALAYQPNVLLLDEPFGALDVKIRGQLRRRLNEIQQKLRVTTILVTHDQEEAFELGNRIGVIEKGKLLEVGAPEELYSSPKSLFVSTFLGSGTVLVGRANGDRAIFGPLSLPLPQEGGHDEGAPVQMLFRPEQVSLSEDRPDNTESVLGRGKIVEESFSGSLKRVRIKLPKPPATRQVAPAVPFGEENLLIDAVLPATRAVAVEDVWVSISGWHILQQSKPKLLVCDSGRVSENLLLTADRLAKRLNGTVTLLGVAKNQDAAEELRERLVERKNAVGLEHIQLHLRHGAAAQQILTEQSETLYEVLLVTAEVNRRRSDRGRPVRQLGSTLTDILRRSEVPVLVVNGNLSEFKKVLICTAGGEAGKQDVRLGGRFAKMLGAQVTLLYVSRDSSPTALTLSHLKRALSTLRAMEVEAEIAVRQNSRPSAGILDETTAGQFDLIVLGSHAPRSRVFFEQGDVTHEVLVKADTPVLVIPPIAH